MGISSHALVQKHPHCTFEDIVFIIAQREQYGTQLYGCFSLNAHSLLGIQYRPIHTIYSLQMLFLFVYTDSKWHTHFNNDQKCFLSIESPY